MRHAALVVTHALDRDLVPFLDVAEQAGVVVEKQRVLGMHVDLLRRMRRQIFDHQFVLVGEQVAHDALGGSGQRRQRHRLGLGHEHGKRQRRGASEQHGQGEREQPLFAFELGCGGLFGFAFRRLFQRGVDQLQPALQVRQGFLGRAIALGGILCRELFDHVP